MKSMKMKRLAAGKVSRTETEKKENRRQHLERKEEGRLVRETRRRTVFDFDIWGTENKVGGGSSPACPAWSRMSKNGILNCVLPTECRLKMLKTVWTVATPLGVA